jgi:hypothetical protein
MQVGEALAEIRRRRLYRVDYPDFAGYVRGEFALSRPTAERIISHAQIAQNLLDDGIKLPGAVTQAAIKPLAGLPDEEGLRTACWAFVQSLCPARAPTVVLVSRVARILKEALASAGKSDDEDAGNNEGNDEGLRQEGRYTRRRVPQRESRPFLRSITTLATPPRIPAGTSRFLNPGGGWSDVRLPDLRDLNRAAPAVGEMSAYKFPGGGL